MVPRRLSLRPPARLRAGLVAALMLASACGDSAPTGTDTATTETGTDTELGPEQFETPIFLSPAAQSVTLLTHETEDLVLRVQRFVPGNTRLVIDTLNVGLELGGVSFATLELDPDDQGNGEATITLTIDGALVEGTHEMKLVTTGTTGPLESAPVTITISEPPVDDSADPTLTAALVLPDIAADLELAGIKAGGGAHGPLIAVQTAGAPTARVFADWDPEMATTLPLTGYTELADALTPGVSATPIADGIRVRVAWRHGADGSAIAALEGPWSDSLSGDDTRVFAPLSELLELGGENPEVEWARYGRLELDASSGALVAELLAKSNTEFTLPGERQLVYAPWSTEPEATPGSAAIFTPTVGVGADALGPALLAEPAAAPTAFAVRVGDVRPAILQPGLGSFLISAGLGEARTGVPGLAPATTAAIHGVFGSRTVATGLTTGVFALSLQNTLTVPVEDEDSPANTDISIANGLPEATPRGAIAPALLGGTPVFVIPYGDDAAVHAILSTGMRASVMPVGELQCDAVATPANTAGVDSGVQTLACLHGGALDLLELELTRE